MAPIAHMALIFALTLSPAMAQEATNPPPGDMTPAQINALAGLSPCGDCPATDEEEVLSCPLLSPYHTVAILPRVE